MVGVNFCMRVADLVVEVRALHQGVRRLCADYVLGGERAAAPVDLVVTVAQDAIDAERAISTDEHPWSDSYLETLAVLRAIANELPQRRRLLVHGAVIQYDGRAYLFTAPSGTGKSTHIMLWRQYLDEAVRVVNGDKPFLRILEAADEPPVVYGTPWAGKEGWQENTSAPLASCSCRAANRARRPFAVLNRRRA